MEGLGAAASTIAVIELAAKVASLCLEYSSAVKNARADIERLRQHTESLKTTAEGAQKLLRGSHGAQPQTLQKLHEALDDTHSQLDNIATKLEAKLYTGRRAKAMRSLGLRALKWPFESKDLDKIITNLQRDQASFSAALQIDQTAEIFDISRKIDLPKLPVVIGAAFDSQTNEHDPRCYPDTRVGLLAEIDRWIEDPGGKCIFWLCGMAGTGKSTISRTVAARLSAKNILGASFLFKKGDGDRGKAAMFFTTIASQLVHWLPFLAPYVRNAVENDPAIADKAKGEQFQKLILEPLNKCKDDPHIPALVSVVIDALDECDGDNDVKTIISLLAQANVLRSIRLRVFITSRPELPIRLGFKDVKGKYQGLALHQIPEPVVEHDISAFLRHELARIRDGYNSQALEGLQLPLGWPSEDVIRILTQMAVPLFIFAATICRFVDDKGRSNPNKRLKKVLQYRTATHGSGLDKLDTTYLPVLNQLTSGRTDQDKTNLLAGFRDIVGPIILLAQPLSVRSLALLLDVETEDVYDQLNSLHSVLDIPSQIDTPVRLFHLSFRDFFVDPNKRAVNDFWIDETKNHKTLADRCIQLMHQHLKRDVCSLQIPGKLWSDIDQQTINTSLPSEVQYACQYWVYHLKNSRANVRDSDSVHNFLTGHLLHWLEALGLLGRISESIGMVDDLLVLLDSIDAIEVSALLRDIRRVILSNRSIIDIAPLQVYISALLFSPARSVTRKVFRQEEPQWITIRPAIEEEWSACQQTLEGHINTVYSVAFSRDSTLIASASRDKTIKIWDTTTGTCTQTLEGHNNWVYSTAFSWDSTLIVSASHDETVKIWDIATGVCIQTLKGHSGIVYSVAFSQDSTLVASASSDKAIKIWDTTADAYTYTLKGHSNHIRSVAFSWDSTLVVSGSDDNTIKIWDTITGTCTQTLTGHSSRVYSVTFSPNSTLIASGSGDNTVKIWDIAIGACIQTLEGHSNSIRSVSFSWDSKLIVSASGDNTIKIWDTITGTCTRTLKGHSNVVYSVAFSRSTLIASGSGDNTIKIWDTTTNTYIQVLEGHRDWVRSVAFSWDSTLVASGSGDSTIKIWDTTGACLQTLEGHSSAVYSVAFSQDSTLIASASDDNTVKIWDIARGTCTQTLNVSRILSHISFNHTGSHLYTDTSTIDLATQSILHAVPPTTGTLQPVCRPDYGISQDSMWITRSSENWLWLPPGYRPVCSAIAASTIVIGCASGRVVFMTFSADK